MKRIFNIIFALVCILSITGPSAQALDCSSKGDCANAGQCGCFGGSSVKYAPICCACGYYPPDRCYGVDWSGIIKDDKQQGQAPQEVKVKPL